MHRSSLILLLCAALFLPGCESRETTPAPPVAPKVMPVEEQTATPSVPLRLPESVSPQVVEHPAAALPLWRRHIDVKPTLILVSNDPFLEPLPDELATEIIQLIRAGSVEWILEKSSPQVPDPLLLPSMAVSAALDAGFFGKVIWLLPHHAEPQSLSAESFRRQLIDYGAASDTEAATFELAGNALRGSIRGVPWIATPFNLFAGTDEPVVLHFDLSLVKSLYKNEIKTPLYPLLGELITPLGRARLKVLDLTISLSQVTAQVPLDTRFIGRDLATLIADPRLFDGDLPTNWLRRAEILYLLNFFQKEQILARYLEMNETDPQDASVDYGLYQISRQMKNEDKALEYLALAVALDPAYAWEYLALAQDALHQGNPEAALGHMDKAVAALAGDPFVAHQRARLLLVLGRKKEALEHLKALRQLPWSPVYYQGLPFLLDEDLAKALELQE